MNTTYKLSKLIINRLCGHFERAVGDDISFDPVERHHVLKDKG